MFSKILVLSFLILPSAWSSYESADKSYGRGTVSLNGYRRTIIDLVNDGYYFSTVPWMKDYIVKNNKSLDIEMEKALDTMLYHTGVKPFESLPASVLERSRSGNIRYILAKKLFKNRKHREALQELSGISADHPAYPFVTHLKGTILSHLKNYSEAESQFKDCIRISERMMGKVKSETQKNQLETNKDYCVAGIGRVQFAQNDFKKAELTYLDIEKDSFVWPEILFEEAWTSYYLKNYNRTLGKLVSYKAPVFDFIFNPEVEVLKALTYLKMCLYDDARKTADGFYNELLKPSRDLRNFLLSRGKDYRYFYGLMADHEDNKPSPLPVVDNILKSVRKDPAYLEMKSALSSAITEYNELRKKSRTSMNANLIKNVRTLLGEYRNTLGAYVRAGMVSKYAELYSAFQGMSYIKLEVLAQRKEKLYETDLVEGRKRGDVKYIERNDKQYFWTFNGEFWADELGDYVFALRSEC
ncbi:MAG: tetratricopeptide repeat protein [Bacteriovoracia bacterium]